MKLISRLIFIVWHLGIACFIYNVYSEQNYCDFMNEQSPIAYKIAIIGNTGTGKTNIATRFINNEYASQSKTTIGVQFLHQNVNIGGKNIKVTLWDTAGQEKYKGLSKVYYKGSAGILIVYDITDPQTYLDVQSWMRHANEAVDLSEVVVMVIGNKADLEEQRIVPLNRPIREYKEKFDIDCREVSAKTGFNVREAIMQMVEQIHSRAVTRNNFMSSSYIIDSISHSELQFSKKLENANNPNDRDNEIIEVENLPVPFQLRRPQRISLVARDYKKKKQGSRYCC